MFQPKSLSVIILKPTKACNATCTHCSSPPDSSEKITLNEFEEICKKIEYYVSPNVNIIWHGGEPLLMGTEYYYKAKEIALKYFPNMYFSMQTNMLIYNDDVFKMFNDVFKHMISTSYDYYTDIRQINGNIEKYKNKFNINMENYSKDLKEKYNVINKMYVVNVIDRKNLKHALDIYNIAKEKQFNLRVNYIYSVGRSLEDGSFNNNFNPLIHITPQEYGEFLITIAKNYFNDVENYFNSLNIIRVVPIYDMLKNYLNNNNSSLAFSCPWTNSCTGHFLGIEPNKNVYNCPDLADVDGYIFGNIIENSAKEVFFSDNAKFLSKRRYNLPEDCLKCEYLQACQGGCMRDSYIYNGDIHGKFFFCESWKMLFHYFDTIKKENLIFIYKKIENFHYQSSK
jgi:radical SAM protein with 4Fe4S-binding SPASM domain